MNKKIFIRKALITSIATTMFLAGFSVTPKANEVLATSVINAYESDIVSILSVVYFETWEEIEKDIERQIQEQEVQQQQLTKKDKAIIQQLIAQNPRLRQAESDFRIETVRGNPIQTTVRTRPGGQLPGGVSFSNGGSLGFTTIGGSRVDFNVSGSVGANFGVFSASISAGMQTVNTASAMRIVNIPAGGRHVVDANKTVVVVPARRYIVNSATGARTFTNNTTISATVTGVDYIVLRVASA